MRLLTVPTRQGHLRPDGSRVYPSVALLCGFPTPTATKPSLLLHQDVITMFHELGHGIHDLVSKTRYARFHGSAGTVVDFGEAPSQMLENWYRIPSELKQLSRHYSSLSEDHLRVWRQQQIPTVQAGSSGACEEAAIEAPEPQLSDEMIDKLLQSKSINKALGYLNDLVTAIWDFTIHDQQTRKAAKDMNISAIYNRLRREIFPVDTPWHLGEGDEWGHPYTSWKGIACGDYNAG